MRVVAKGWALLSRLAHTAGSFFSWGLAPSTPLDLGEGCRMAAAEAYIQASIPRAILIQAVAILAQLLALFALFEVSLCVLFLLSVFVLSFCFWATIPWKDEPLAEEAGGWR